MIPPLSDAKHDALKERLLRAYSSRTMNAHVVVDAPDLYEVIGILQDRQQPEKEMSMKFEERCPDGQKCGCPTTGCQVWKCQRNLHGELTDRGSITVRHIACPDPDSRCQHGDDLNCPVLGPSVV